jgi:valacyclovir hydrolase
MPTFFHNDHQLFYREEGSGPLLLLLPGNTASSASHAGELAYFGQRYCAVSLDFWGTGQSDRLAEWPEDWWEVGAQDAAPKIFATSVITFYAGWRRPRKSASENCDY